MTELNTSTWNVCNIAKNTSGKLDSKQIQNKSSNHLIQQTFKFAVKTAPWENTSQ